MLGWPKRNHLGLFIYFFVGVKLNKLENIPAGLGHSFVPTYHFLQPQVLVCLDPPESWGDYQRKEAGQTGNLDMALGVSSPVRGRKGHGQGHPPSFPDRLASVT